MKSSRGNKKQLVSAIEAHFARHSNLQAGGLHEVREVDTLISGRVYAFGDPTPRNPDMIELP